MCIANSCLEYYKKDYTFGSIEFMIMETIFGGQVVALGQWIGDKKKYLKYIVGIDCFV